MHKTIEVIRDIRKLCTHEFEVGHRCASPALRGETFCYYHHPTRKPVRTFESDRKARRARSLARKSFTIPVPTNRRELQISLNEMMKRLAANQLDVRRAAVLLRALHISSRNMSPSNARSLFD